MTNRSETTIRFEKEIVNAGVPPLEEKVNDDQAPMNPLPLTDENIRVALFQMAQAITTQA